MLLFLLLFSCQVLSNSLWPHRLQDARPLCPSPSPRVCPNSGPLNRWCHPTISSSVAAFFSCLQSFPASGSFPMKSTLRIRWLKYRRFSFSINPSNEYSGLIYFSIERFDLLAFQKTLESLLQYHSSKVSILRFSAFFCCPALTSMHDYWKNHSFD